MFLIDRFNTIVIVDVPFNIVWHIGYPQPGKITICFVSKLFDNLHKYRIIAFKIAIVKVMIVIINAINSKVLRGVRVISFDVY